MELCETDPNRKNAWNLLKLNISKLSWVIKKNRLRPINPNKSQENPIKSVRAYGTVWNWSQPGKRTREISWNLT